MDIKVCGHKCLRILRSRSIAISKEITINERLVECTKCTFQRSEYEITNYDLKNFQNEILANLPPKYINESLEERAERLYENQEYVDAVKAYESLIELEEKIINGKKNKKTQWFLRLAEINAKLGKYKKSLKILDDLNIPIKDKQSKYREFCIRIFLNSP